MDDMEIGNVNQGGGRDSMEWEGQGEWEGMWDPATIYGQPWESQEGSFDVQDADYEYEAPPGLMQLGKGKAMDKGKGKGWGWSPWSQPSSKGWKGKGKGKGDKGGGKGWGGGGKGYGQGDGWGGGGKGYSQGGGKGGGKAVARAPFWGNCYNCGKSGHSAKECPELGKGFQGNCNLCGEKGHKAVECPKKVNSLETGEPKAPVQSLALGGMFKLFSLDKKEVEVKKEDEGISRSEKQQEGKEEEDSMEANAIGKAV